MAIAVSMFVAMMLTPLQSGNSYYTSRLEDPKAVYVTKGELGIQGDGIADDTAGLQRAIDRALWSAEQGIVFIPEGRYRLTKTLTVWGGVRLIGYGSKRPVFLLGDNTPGYQETEKLMVFFAGRQTNVDRGSVAGQRPPEQPAIPASAGRDGGDFGVPNDANPGTFYSAMSNIDLEVGTGNPAAVGIRGRYAQHGYLAHMDFRLRSGLAAIHDIGNEADDLRFFGGDYGIITRTPSPGWQFTLLDSCFNGQLKAAIRTHVTGLTLVRTEFRNVPTAISVDPGFSEQLWFEDGRMENVSGPAIQISREHNPRTQINIENLICRNVPTLAEFRESGRKVAGSGENYAVDSFSHGFHYADLGSKPVTETNHKARPLASFPPPVPSPIPVLPSTDSWVNLATLGAKGDGTTDNTEILRAAIAKYRTIYLPSGNYRVTDTITLKSDTILVGLNPGSTHLLITDGTPEFGGQLIPLDGEEQGPFLRTPQRFPGHPKPLLQSSKGGTNVVTGIGLDTGGNNPAAVAALWLAGKDSMIDDVKFVGGHGSGVPIYNENHSGDPNPARKWDSQYPSLWVTDGGGGIFKNIWTASTFAQAGMLVSNTSTPGRVYEISSEHHVRAEIQIRNSSNWHFVALQTEEERGEGAFALPLEIDRCHDITVANLNMYRVVSVTQPFSYAVKVSDSRDIRFRNVHCYSNSKASFDSLLFDATHGVELRQREFANLTLNGEKPKLAVKGPRVEKLAGGFFNISGGAVHPNGDFYFVDARWNRIYRWNDATKSVSPVQDFPLSPTNLVFDQSGNLMVVAYAGKGTVYTFRPDSSEEPKLIRAESSQPRQATAVLPVTDWLLHDEIVSGKPLARPYHFVSPDGSTFIAAGQDFVDGTLTWGVKLQDVIRSFGLAKTVPGQPFYLTGESEMRTYAVGVQPDGTLTKPRLFAEQGGEGVAVDAKGNVYIAAGQIYIYSPEGRPMGQIDTPERPTQLAFGGKDGKTLFITARTSLYSVRIR